MSYGSALYSTYTLSQISFPILNLHTGILPKYRNVHTDFWAYVNYDHRNIGVTLFRLTEKIDDGLIIREVRSDVSDQDFLWTIKKRNLETVLKIIKESIEESRTSILYEEIVNPPFSDGIDTRRLWPTPSASDLLNYFKLESRKFLKKQSPISLKFRKQT
jgi:methionyl-tRNA formyltransferase